MGSREVEIVERRVAYQGYFRLDRYLLRHGLHAGGMSDVLDREVMERGRVAAVLPVDPVRDELVLIEQFRPGAMAAGMDPWLLECVAGVLEGDESPEDLARREAREEAGCTITDLMPIQDIIASPGACSETIALFCGRVDTRGIGGIHGLAHEGEDILVHVMPVDRGIELLDEGRIVNAKTIIALHWLARHYDRVKRAWHGVGASAEPGG